MALQESQLELFDHVDLYSDEELMRERAKLDVKYARIRGLVLKGRVPRATLDKINEERERLGAEIVRRRL